MECQSLFSGENKKKYFNMSFSQHVKSKSLIPELLLIKKKKNKKKNTDYRFCLNCFPLIVVLTIIIS